ncbi:MAG: FtsH protease activity modulator HflK [Alphaproteobacteria bacterium]
MPWTSQNGGGRQSGRGPWGQGPGQQPPDLEELLKRSQDKLRRFVPGGMGRSGLLVALLIVVVVWLLTGIYTVNPSEQGVVTRFGKFVAVTTPGINYHLPWPIETAYTPQVTQPIQVDIGYRRGSDFEESGAAVDVPEESLMLTGDENIVDIGFTVFWIIKDAPAYLFNVEDINAAIKAVAESAMREVVGRNQIALIQTVNRQAIQDEVRQLMQQILDSYGAGVIITEVKMQKVDPPSQVIDAYRDVQAARTDQERMRNEAEAYANKVVPEARGEAARIVQQAEGYKQRVMAEAQGEAQRFISVYNEYRKAPEVTRRRIYLETMQNVMTGTNKVIVEKNNVIPYLPLPSLQQAQPGGRGSQ